MKTASLSRESSEDLLLVVIVVLVAVLVLVVVIVVLVVLVVVALHGCKSSFLYDCYECSMSGGREKYTEKYGIFLLTNGKTHGIIIQQNKAGRRIRPHPQRSERVNHERKGREIGVSACVGTGASSARFLFANSFSGGALVLATSCISSTRRSATVKFA